MIDALNKQKDKWQELLEIREVAEAYALVGDAMSEFGYTVEDVLNDTPGAFEAFSKAYIEALSGSNAGNDKFLEGLQKTLETGSANLNQFADDMPGIMSKMSSAVENSGLKSSIENTLGHLFDDAKGTVEDNAKLISGNITDGLISDFIEGAPGYVEAGDAAGKLGTHVVEEIADKSGCASPSKYTEETGEFVTQGLANGITGSEDGSIPESNPAISAAENLAKAVIEKFKETFEGEDFSTIFTSLQTALSSEGGLASLINSLDTLTLTNLIAQFTSLQSAISDATAAIGGGGGGAEDSVDANSSQGVIGSAEQTSGGNSLTDALKNQVEDAKTLLPEETALFNGDSDSLLAGVNDVINALDGGSAQKGGNQGEGGSGESNGEDDPNTLIGANKIQYDFAAKFIPSETNLFYILANAIAQCVAQLSEMLIKMKELSEMEVPGVGSFAGTATLYTGTAYANGKWNAGSKGTNGKSLVGELGSEIIVHSNGTYETVGEHGAEFKNIKPSDIVFNHKQSEALLKYGHINSRGKAYAEGNLPQGFSLLPEDQLSRFNLFNKADIPTMSGINTAFERQTKDLTATIKAVTNSSTINNAPIVNITGDNHFDCAGLQPEQVSKAVNDAFMGMANRTYQKTMSR